MLRISIAASLLAITLSFDAFAMNLEDAESPGNTYPRNASLRSDFENPDFDRGQIPDAALLKILGSQHSPERKLETPLELEFKPDQTSLYFELLKKNT